MADQSTKQARKRRRPLESYSKPWLGTIAIAVVAVLIGAMLLVKAAGVGYRHYTAQFLQAAALQAGNPITVAGIQVGEVTSMKLVGDQVEAGLKRSRRRRTRQGLQGDHQGHDNPGLALSGAAAGGAGCAARRHVRPLPHRGPL